ncbi:MAG: hypothetical protein ABJN40_22360 [Sneathiella sp.]
MVDAIGRSDALYHTQRIAAADDAQQATAKVKQSKREGPTDIVEISHAGQQILKLVGQMPLTPLTGAQSLEDVDKELKTLFNQLNIPSDTSVTFTEHKDGSFSVSGDPEMVSLLEEKLNNMDEPSYLRQALKKAGMAARMEFDAAQWAAVANDPNGTGPGIPEAGGMTILTRSAGSLDYPISLKNGEVSASFFDKQGNPALPEGAADELSQWVPFSKTPVLN